MSDWQPIETAPKDGTEVLLWCHHGCEVAWFENGREFGPSSEPFNAWTTGMETSGGVDCGYRLVVPSHWMPLPEPPK